jgi:zinc/manganese transport system permease protein
MSGLLQLMITPFVTCMILVAMLAYLGVHVIAREVIFVDLSLAQMAALGTTSALLFNVEPNSALGYAFALGFTTIGAFIFAMTRTAKTKQRVPHEAIIGIVYIVASAAALLVADRAPKGAEAIKDLLVGSLLWVTWPAVLKLFLVYLGLAIFHYLLRNRFMTISLKEDEVAAQGWNVKWWDFLFYLSFGVAITLAVPIAGVLLVFTFLVVPSVIAFLFTRREGMLIVVSWVSSAIASALGLFISFRFDLPTGPLIVCVFGLVLLAAGGVRRLVTARGTP